jgi:hypothetical protein
MYRLFERKILNPILKGTPTQEDIKKYENWMSNIIDEIETKHKNILANPRFSEVDDVSSAAIFNVLLRDELNRDQDRLKNLSMLSKLGIEDIIGDYRKISATENDEKISNNNKRAEKYESDLAGAAAGLSLT